MTQSGIALAAILMLIGSSLAFADQGKSQGKGKGKGETPAGQTQGHDRQRDHDGIDIDIRFDSRARGVIGDYYRRHPDCPPGLAKKNNGCLPPGLAKKRYQIGAALPYELRGRRPPRDLYHALPPPPAGHVYGYVDGDVLLVAEATHRVVDAIVAVDAAVNAPKR